MLEILKREKSNSITNKGEKMKKLFLLFFVLANVFLYAEKLQIINCPPLSRPIDVNL